MLNSSKKNMGTPNKQTSTHAKTLKRSKSTQHLVPKKTHKKTAQRGNSEQPHAYALTKSKSTKSLKPKSKKTDTSCKKIKGKKSGDTKTVKKGQPHRETNEVSSILTDQFQTKKTMLEYFVYQNNYIPIENSAQRRLVYKIQMIDLENQSTTTSFHNKKSQAKAVGTDVVVTEEKGVGERFNTEHNSTQTEVEQIKKQFEEKAEKCFVDVLTELQFYYLPNQQNFTAFSQTQRIHYGQLLQTLAKKMLAGGREIVIESLSEEQITVLLYQREGIQVGALQFIPLQGFPTHLLSILAYLKNLFCFIQYGFKEQVLTGLRLFYGYNYNERVNRLTRGLPHQKDHRDVLSEQLFQAFEHQMFKDYEFTSQTAKQSVHAHNRALFDAVNAQLQMFRPFFSSEGEPFPWTNNLGMTHYDITEQALYIIFVQVKQKIQRQVLTLCGMHLDFDDESLPKAEKCPLYQKKMLQRQQKMLHDEMKKMDDRVELDYSNSVLMFQLSSSILSQLMQQLESQLLFLGREDIDEDFQFQYFN